ncbi:Cytochrome P450 CYP4 [Frankliniella occidentalis]|uniref:Cytochrome P450 4c3-like n=1 Tax=Frankliniella occidentalis TaxID=133901 RepID=A0A6J1SRX5_FRAOC|nr:cytochrome P450 4c3-like [Frankliniella occidentalis]XP_052123820.1 cytochrome P450 4c3-like [Frankliniella occidentalis]KAE8746536.1 Cytochrome P450 CYP4 [Frankliniella occidentalis]
MISALTIVLLALPLVLYVVDKVRRTSKLAHLAGPSYPLPLLGHLKDMFGPRATFLDRCNAFLQRWGPEPVKFWVGETPSVSLTRPEDLEPLLSSQREVFKPDQMYKAVSGFFGDGLITLNGDQWFAHRRALTPAFHFKVLERYAGIFTRRAAALAEQLSSEVPAGQSFNIVRPLGAFVIGSIMETAFGIDAATDESHRSDTMDRLVRATEDAFFIVMHRIFHPWLLIDFVFKLTPHGRVARDHEDIICDMTRRVIAAKKAQLKQGAKDAAADQDDVKGAVDDDDGVRKKFTFLDMALGDKSLVLSDKEIIEEVRTLIAVQQTTASTLSFIAVMLALNPEVQERARAEVREVDAVEGLLPLDRLKRLKYVERVIKETLRLFPVTAAFGRKLKSEVKLPTQTIPAGVVINMFVYRTHRDPRHWPEPERFDPDRFLPEQCAGRHPYAYVPFSAGPRNCIGQRYAMLQMLAVVSAWLARFRLLPGDGCESREALRVNMDIFLCIEGGANVRLEPLEA